MNKTGEPSLDPARAALALTQSLDAAQRSLARRPSHNQVHAARKSLKKARAALRLLRPDLGERRYRTENLALRDAGRILAPLRDAKVLADALRDLGASGLPALRHELQRRLAAETRHLSAQRRQECAHTIRASRERVATALAPTHEGLAHGLTRIYRQGRRATPRKPALEQPDAFHEWRKQAKHLRHALEALAGPAAAKARAHAERLGDLLGDDHDAAALWDATLRSSASAAPRAAPPATETAALERLHARLAQRRKRLQKHALALGAKLYRRKPRAFVRHIVQG